MTVLQSNNSTTNKILRYPARSGACAGPTSWSPAMRARYRHALDVPHHEQPFGVHLHPVYLGPRALPQLLTGAA